MRIVPDRSPIAGAALAALLATALAAPARALPRPALELATGATAAVDGAPDGGGLSLGLAATWPFAARWSAGVRLFADDLGTEAGELRDPNDGTPLGAAAGDHRMAWGAAWRFDRSFAARRGWEPRAELTWGWYRLVDDRLGDRFDAESSAGVSVGAGVLRPVRGDFAAGASLRWHQLFNDRSRGWLAAGLDWSWR